ncbi:nicotinamide N-methyltransferase-like [Pelodytes ibericus]
MASQLRKIYNPRQEEVHLFFETYLSPTSSKFYLFEFLNSPLQQLHNCLIKGIIDGGSVIDISAGPGLCHLLPICPVVSDITVLKNNALEVAEVEKYAKKQPDAIDWTHVTKNLSHEQSDEEDLRGKIKNILTCDFAKDNIADPIVLAKADYLLSLYALNLISQNEEAYAENLKKVSSLLKVGGQLFLFGMVNGSYITVGEEKYQLLSISQEFAKKALADIGLVTEHLEVTRSKTRGTVTDYEEIWFISAFKVVEH